MINYDALFDSAPNPYMILDPSLIIVEVNQAYLNATMAQRDMLLGQHLFDAFPANPEDLDANGVSNLQASLEDVLNYGKAHTMAIQKYDIPKRDGSSGFEERFWCAVNSPVIGEDNEVVLIIHNPQDVTEFIRKQPEQGDVNESLKKHANLLEAEVYRNAQSLQEVNNKLKIANEAKSTFLTSMSHELRTPLNVILGFTRILERDLTIGKEQREEISCINRSGNHLLTLINDVLDLAKIEAGKIALVERGFNLDVFLSDISKLFGNRTIDQGLFFNLEKDAGVPRYIKGDEGKLRQVLINLLGNALKYTETGGLTLRVKSAKDKENIYTLHFEVEDTGIGINTEYLEKIFDPFVQAVDSQNKIAGTGLGLSISRRFVELMRGKIDVESKINNGSLFRFNISVGGADASDVEDFSRSRRVIGLAPDQPTFRILVVEDMLESRKLLVKLLKSVGFEAEESSDGKQGVEAFNSWHPDLIWMDMRMPVMDGYEATKQIKETEAGKKTVIVALTAHAFEEERQKILKTGCDDFIKKPYLEEELFAAMEKHLGVQFLYEDQDASFLEIPVNPSPILTPETISDLPSEIKRDLLNVAGNLDQKGCFAILEQLSVTNKDVASVLRTLVENYKFEELESILG